MKQNLLDLKLKFQKYSDKYTPDTVPIVQRCPTLIFICLLTLQHKYHLLGITV